MQNVEAAYYNEHLAPDLRQLGYEGQYVAAPGGGGIGVATFWSSGTFKLLKVRAHAPSAASSLLTLPAPATPGTFGNHHDHRGRTVYAFFELRDVADGSSKCCYCMPEPN